MADSIKTYTYTAQDNQDTMRTGEYSALDQNSVASYLMGMGLKPINIAEKKKSIFKQEFNFLESVAPSEVYNFTRQLAVMLRAGVPLIDALEAMESNQNNPAVNRMIVSVVHNVSSGMTFSAALAEHPKVFDSMFIFIVKAGETAGVIDLVMMKIAEFIKHDLEMRNGIKSALRYPAIVMTITIAVAVLAVVYLLPRFSALFMETRIELPAMTRFYLGIDQFIQNNYIFIIAGIAIAAVVFFQTLKTTQGRYYWDKFLLNIPIFGPISRGISISRFSNIFETLNSSGVPILNCLDIVGKTVGNAFIQFRLSRISRDVQIGKKVAESLRKHTSDIFPPHVLKMIEVGEEAGAIDDMMHEIAILYDNEVRNMVQRLTASVEPIITVTMGIFILTLALAIFVPVWDSYVALTNT
jgi:type II secretory pathway component PulF